MTRFIREEGRQGELALYVTDKGNRVLVPMTLYRELKGFHCYDYKIKAREMGEFHLLTAINDKTLREEFRGIPEKYRILDRAHRAWLAKDNAWRLTPARQAYMDLFFKKDSLEKEVQNFKSKYSSFEGFYNRITGTRETMSSHIPEDEVLKYQSLLEEITALKGEIENALVECGPEPERVPPELYLTDREWDCVETVTGMRRDWNDQDEMITNFMGRI